MGWLPIALALAGFVFFVAIVNYNSINTHKQAIMMAFFQFCQTAKARHTLLRTIQEVPELQACHVQELEDDFNLANFGEYALAVKKEIRSIEDSRLFLRVNRPAERDLRKALKSLQVLNHRQHINIRIFKRKVREYNQLIDTYPTKLVARAMALKPLKA